MNNDKTTAAEPTASTGQKPSAAQPESLISPADTGTIQAASDTSAHTANTSHDPAEQPQPVLPENLGEPAHTKKRPGGFFKKLGIFLLILMLLMLLPAAALIGYALIDRANPAGHIPDGYYALVSVTSASDTLQKGLYLSAADALLASPETAALQSNLRALRANTALQSGWFTRLLDIPIYAAVYERQGAALIADIGIRAAAVRLLPLVMALKPDLLAQIPNLSPHTFDINGEKQPGFLLQLGKDQTVCLCVQKNLVIAATSEALLAAYLTGNDPKTEQQLTELFRTQKDAVNVYASPSYALSGFADKQTIVGNMLRELAFPDPAALSARFDDKAIALHSTVSWSSLRDEVRAILQRRSALPAILSRLPEGVAYLTLLNLGDPHFLYQNTQPFFTPDMAKLFATAEKNCKLFFNKDLQQLMFEWMGSETGVFGHQDAQSPVFFIALKDEAKCRTLLDDLFDTAFLDRNTSALVDGNRIPRIVFPSWIAALLRALHIDLPEPFYMIQDGYLYLSKSAEALGLCKKEIDTGKLLVKTEQWKDIAKDISAETSFLVYYSLDRSIPFFFEQNALLKTALKNYGKGVLSLRFAADNHVYLDLYTQKTDSKRMEEIPAFPRTLSERVGADTVCAKTAAKAPYLFWTNGANVHSMNLLTGKEAQLTLDGAAGIAAELTQNTFHALWAVSARGSIYKVNEALEPAPGFPVLSAEKLLPKPAVVTGGIAVPLAAAPVLLFADSSGSWSMSDTMEAKLRTAPVVFNQGMSHGIAALPRSFESCLYLFNEQGKLDADAITGLDGIFAAKPVLFTAPQERKANKNRSTAAAFLNEEGRFSIRRLDSPHDELGFCELNAVCKADFVYSESAHAFFAVSQDGLLFKINAEAEIADSLQLKTGAADDYCITLLDTTGDGLDEVLISGGGNAIYAYTAGLTPVAGFPVAGTGTPYLLDIDGDAAPELITYGIDSKLHAYKGTALR